MGRLSSLVVIWLAACGNQGSSPAGERPTPPSRGEEPAAELRAIESGNAEAPDESAAVCAAVGYTEAPPEPSAAARRTNREGLALHERADYEASAAKFEEAGRLSPGYASARFNLACARARLGLVEEARGMLSELMCTDLPTYAPKVLADPDLESVRAEGAVHELVSRITAQYVEAIAGGAPLVASRSAPSGREGGIAWTWAQAGVYQPDGGRFIPMGPRLRQRDGSPWGFNRGYAGIVTRFDPASRRVAAITFVDNDSEGGAPMVRVVVRLYRAPIGESMLEVPVRNPDQVQIAFAPGGLLMKRAEISDEEQWLVTSAGRTSSSASMPTPFLMARGFIRGPAAPPAGYAIARGRLVTPSGAHALGRGHRVMRHTNQVIVDPSGTHAIAASMRGGDCGSTDRHVIDRVDLSSGTVSRLREGEGLVRAELLDDGALYLQIEEKLFRYSSIDSDEAIELPRWLLLTPQPRMGNPYC